MEMENQNNIDEIIIIKPVVRERVVDNYELLGFGSILYGLVYTFCMYRNFCGLATTLLVYLTFAYGVFILKKLGYSFNKKHIVYGVLGALLGANLMFTLDYWVLFVDYVAILLVFVSGVFSVVCDNTGWSFTDHVWATVKHIFSSITEVFDIFYDFGEYNKEKKSKNGTVKYIILGLVVALPLVILVVILLSGADAVFAQYTDNLFGKVDFGTVIGLAFTCVGAVLGSYAWIVHFLNEEDYIVHKDKRTAEPIILITIGIVLGLVYVLFCGIQIVYLFAGVGELPAGYTYATYAREGFFQLLFVCLLNLVFVLVGISRFKENIVLKVILTIITGCTYIMIASSAYRMYLYIGEYQLSVLRLWVLWTLVWLVFMMTGALVNVYVSSFSLFRYSMVATASLYLLLAFSRPAYVVAEYNLSDRFATEDVDFAYIRCDLGPDAYGPVSDYYNNASDEVKKRMVSYFPSYDERQENKSNVRNFNISRFDYYSNTIR